jgi:hypothetical protein
MAGEDGYRPGAQASGLLIYEHDITAHIFHFQSEDRQKSHASRRFVEDENALHFAVSAFLVPDRNKSSRCKRLHG